MCHGYLEKGKALRVLHTHTPRLDFQDEVHIPFRLCTSPGKIQMCICPISSGSVYKCSRVLLFRLWRTLTCVDDVTC